jgi:hypothetical protein
MEFALFKNTRPETVADAIRAWDRDEADSLEEANVPSMSSVSRCKIPLNPGTNLRKKGTLQRGLRRISSRAWQYDSEPLQLAVICQRKWAPVEITNQRFAVVVSLSHEDDSVDIYARARQQARVYQRIRVKV